MAHQHLAHADELCTVRQKFSYFDRFLVDQSIHTRLQGRYGACCLDTVLFPLAHFLRPVRAQSQCSYSLRLRRQTGFRPSPGSGWTWDLLHSRLAGSRGDSVEGELQQRAGEDSLRRDGDDAAPARHIGRTTLRPRCLLKGESGLTVGSRPWLAGASDRVDAGGVDSKLSPVPERGGPLQTISIRRASGTGMGRCRQGAWWFAVPWLHLSKTGVGLVSSGNPPEPTV